MEFTYPHGDNFENSIVWASFLHDTVYIIQQLYSMLMYVYKIYYHYFNIQGHILGYVAQEKSHSSNKNGFNFCDNFFNFHKTI